MAGVVDLVARLAAARRRSGRSDRILLVAATAVFAVSFAAALRSLPDVDVEVRWPLLLVAALVLVPAASLANALEYVVVGRLDHRRVGVRAAVEVSVLSSAANLLPIPGAALVRARALRRLGSTLGRAVSATATAGMAWLATAVAVAGALLVGAEPATGAGFLALAVVGLAAAAVLARRVAGGRGATGPVLVALLAVEALSVAIGAARGLLVLRGLGFEVSAAQAAALTVAAVGASAVGFLPGGLGLRELLAAAISPVVGLSAAVGVVGSAVDRLIGLPPLALASVVLAARPPTASAEPPGTQPADGSPPSTVTSSPR